MNDSSPDRQDKFRRYRSRKKARGLREVRLWLPDVNAPGFWERSVAAAAILRNAAEEEETMLFIEAMQAERRRVLGLTRGDIVTVALQGDGKPRPAVIVETDRPGVGPGAAGS
jgi:hypothetical protein